eukprot:322570_1
MFMAIDTNIVLENKVEQSQSTVCAFLELKEIVNKLVNENAHLKNEIHLLQDKINQQVLQVSKLEKKNERLQKYEREESPEPPNLFSTGEESVEPPKLFGADKANHVVIGWIRQTQKCLNLKNVPEEISLICMEYYKDDEVFVSIQSIGANMNMEVSEDQKSVTRTGGWSWGNCNHYGINVIPSTNAIVCEWTLKLQNHDTKHTGGIRVGVVSEITQSDYNSSQSSGAHYIWWNKGERFSDMILSPSCWPWDGWGEGFEQAQYLSIILDLRGQSVRFLVNDTKDEGIVVCQYSNIKIDETVKYRLFVSIYYKGDSVEIVNFATR